MSGLFDNLSLKSIDTYVTKKAITVGGSCNVNAMGDVTKKNVILLCSIEQAQWMLKIYVR